MHLTSKYAQSEEDKGIIKTIIYFIISVIIVIASLITLLVNNKNLDKNIHKCISDNTTLISTSNNIILEIGSAQRRLLALAVVTNKNRQNHMLERWEISVSKSQTYHDSLEKQIQSNPKIVNHPIILSSKKLRLEYLKSARKFIRLIHENGNENQISKYLINDLGPEFKNYRLNQMKLLTLLNHEFIAQSHVITGRSSTTVWIVFFVGLFPFFMLAYRILK